MRDGVGCSKYSRKKYLKFSEIPQTALNWPINQYERIHAYKMVGFDSWVRRKTTPAPENIRMIYSPSRIFSESLSSLV